MSAVVRWNKKTGSEKKASPYSTTLKRSLLWKPMPWLSSVYWTTMCRMRSSIVFPIPKLWIHVAIVEEGAEMQAKVSVKDQGPGLSDEDKQKVFGKMQRLSAKPTAGEHSTGLGLFIVKQLVEAHGGEVGVESIHGEGATFWFTLKAPGIPG